MLVDEFEQSKLTCVPEGVKKSARVVSVDSANKLQLVAAFCLAYSLRRGSVMATTGPVLCILCDKPEQQCTCDRYCAYCKGLEGIRLCVDGQYYCPDCREACDIRVVDALGH